MSPEALEPIGRMMSDAELSLVKGIGINQLAEEGSAEQTFQVLGGLAGGVHTKQDIPVTVFHMQTKDRTNVEVSSTDAMKVILEDGGKLLKEQIKVVTI